MTAAQLARRGHARAVAELDRRDDVPTTEALRAAIVGAYGSIRRAAIALRIGRQSLCDYLDGETAPPLSVVERVAVRTGVRDGWPLAPVA
jgi:hypothetical protein